jgi:hypothetical protein
MKNITKLNDKIEIYTEIETIDSVGGVTKTKSNSKILWCNITFIESFEIKTKNQTLKKERCKFVVLKQSPEISYFDKILYKTKIFEIEQIISSSNPRENYAAIIATAFVK